MDKTRFMLSLIAIAFSYTAIAADTPSVPVITIEPFEPSYCEFYKPEDKYAHPKEIISPRPLWPFEKRRAESAQSGDVIVLVQLDQKGFARRLSVLSSTDPLFTRSTIIALKKARWEELPREAYFYYMAHFDLGDMIDSIPNKKPEPMR